VEGRRSLAGTGQKNMARSPGRPQPGRKGSWADGAGYQKVNTIIIPHIEFAMQRFGKQLSSSEQAAENDTGPEVRGA